MGFNKAVRMTLGEACHALDPRQAVCLGLKEDDRATYFTSCPGKTSGLSMTLPPLPPPGASVAIRTARDPCADAATLAATKEMVKGSTSIHSILHNTTCQQSHIRCPELKYITTANHKAAAIYSYCHQDNGRVYADFRVENKPLKDFNARLEPTARTLALGQACTYKV